MAFLIDSSIIITLERRYPGQSFGQSLSELTTAFSEEPVAIAAITASELLRGVHRAKTDQQRMRRETFVEEVLDTIPILPFDLRAARVHARIWAQLRSVGQNPGAHDLLIAATALSRGYAILTDNTKDFGRIPGLIVQQTPGTS